jgi:hypothetical protein
MKRRRSKRSLKRRYGHANWSAPRSGVHRLLDVPASKGEVVVMEYPHFAEVVVAPASGRMSAEMSFPSASQAKQWGEQQAKKLLGVAT